MKILVINAGSSSIKFQLFEMPAGTIAAKGMVERIGQADAQLHYSANTHQICRSVQAADHQQAMKAILAILTDAQAGAVKDAAEIQAVGHRVVHGGEEFTGSVKINDAVLKSIERFADLAPLHNPPNLTGIQAARQALPNAVQVACFDTAFHATIPQTAYLYGLPYEIYEKYRVRRYGFHGTSHRYVARRAAELMGRDKYALNAITCHLGNGCSITAVKNGRSVDTSMGLTPLEGVIMGTRCGDLDPAIVFYLADKGYTVAQLNEMFNKKSGLLGISGVSNDMRNLTEQAAKGHPRAQLAIDIFCYRIKKYIGAYTAVLGTLDAVIFTGGIGENNAAIRRQILSDLPQLGIEVDAARNEAREPKERLISTDRSRVKVYVIPTNEEAAIAADTYRLVQS
ncbi:MAG TPA: acetate kinase [Anaerohalosphaeraceae bacterium]|nr:acetate kinase [Anaerohalosphaeraceae bacterium]HOL88232.1 acetate kinase [Anaerohalosphaeraceae bacterium]HPP56091.1 acetate kinase [Anaerohalosphaeraceae bacterium]